MVYKIHETAKELQLNNIGKEYKINKNKSCRTQIHAENKTLSDKT